MGEQIFIVMPFAYLKLFDEADSIQTKRRIYDAHKLFGRIYWVGIGHRV